MTEKQGKTAKKAPSNLPKRQGEAAKKAPSNLPKKSGRAVILNIILMIVWTGFSVISSQLVVGLVMASILGSEQLDKPIWSGVYTTISYAITLVLVLLVPKKRMTRDELGLRGLPTWTDLGLAPVGFVAHLVLATVLVGLFSIFPWFNVEEAQDVGFSLFLTGFDRVIAFFEIVVIAPIAEEIIFRGWLYGRMRGLLNEKVSDNTSMLISILLVSLLFGIVHLQWNVGVNVFAMSVVVCVLREITGTIHSGILLHMLKNGIAFYLIYILGI